MTTIDEYMNVEYAEQLKIYADKELAIKEREKNERLRTQRILQQRREAAEERRLDNWWSLDDTACPEEGLKAHALLNVLVDNADVDVMTNADRGEIARLENEIQRLQTEYDNDEVPRPELLDEISDLEDELDELTKKIDVYNIIPTGAYYDTQEFEVIDSPEVEGRTYAVGDEDEMESSARDYVVQLIDEMGYEGFSKGFISNHIDEDAVIAYAEDLYEQDVRESPESYIDESERLLSKEQEEEIQILKDKISNIKSLIDRLDSHMDEDNEDEVQERIDGLNENIEEMNDEITEIEDNPDGDYPEDEIEAAIESGVKDVKYDVENFMNEFGLDIENYIDKDSLVQDVVDTDGYGHTLNSYDGTADETYVQDKLYYVMRIN
jgi:DNA repair exonuclease SbcCD ATPase subunit